MWTRELADALRNAVTEIKAGKYCWADASRCNCGVVAQQLLGCNSVQLHQKMRSEDIVGSWGIRCRDRMCSSTGQPLGVVLDRLVEAGMSYNDIADLEMINNPDIRVRANLGMTVCGEDIRHRPIFEEFHRPETIAYMLAWADMIDEQLGPRAPIPVEVVPQLEALLV